MALGNMIPSNDKARAERRAGWYRARARGSPRQRGRVEQPRELPLPRLGNLDAAAAA